MKTSHNWLGGVIACALFLALCAAVDDGHHDSAATDLAAHRTSIEAERDALAQHICNAEMGPGTRVLWTVNGDLVCRPAVLTAQGGTQ